MNNANYPCDENHQHDLVNKWKGSDSVDAAGKVAQAVAAANEAAGLEGAGTLAAQVDALMMEVGLAAPGAAPPEGDALALGLQRVGAPKE